jgi:hypothetical protein
MFLVSIIGAAVAPFMCFIGNIMERHEKIGSSNLYKDFFPYTNLYVILLIGVLLYGVITAYLFNREYVENTLKNLMVIPVSRISFILSKFILLFLWIMVLTLISWALTFFFGLIGQFQGLSAGVLLNTLKEYMIGGSMLFLLATPVIFITLFFKDYVATIVFTIAVVMVNVLILNSRYSPFYPWSAAILVTGNKYVSASANIYSYISILAVSIIGFAATIIYFRKIDIK